MKITHNFGQVADKLEKLSKKSDVEVQVGYTASYALKVHEDLNAFHSVGQAKYLEQPAREKQKQIGKTIVQGVKATGDLGQGFVLGGLFLQRESQMLVPVDTGHLKGSAFTKKVKG